MGWFLIAAIVLTFQSKADACSGCFQTQAPRAASNNMFPQWSPDSRRIVFTSDRDGDPEIYVMNADGSSPIRLTNAKGRDAHPFFSRDGRKIVFQSPRANGVDTNIYVMNADGSNVVCLTDNHKKAQEAQEELLELFRQPL